MLWLCFNLRTIFCYASGISGISHLSVDYGILFPKLEDKKMCGWYNQYSNQRLSVAMDLTNISQRRKMHWAEFDTAITGFQSTALPLNHWGIASEPDTFKISERVTGTTWNIHLLYQMINLLSWKPEAAG